MSQGAGKSESKWFLWTVGFLLLIVLAGFFGADETTANSEDQGTIAELENTILKLPNDEIDANLLLGARRADAKRLLGVPGHSTKASGGNLASDIFDPAPGLGLIVEYRKGKVTRLTISAQWAGRNITQVVKWLKLSESGEIKIEDEVFTVDVPGDNTVVISSEFAYEHDAKRVVLKLREDVATGLEDSFLADGNDAHVSVRGKDKTILRIKWTLCGRPVLHNLVDGENAANLRNVGFNKIECLDGFGGRAWMDL